MITRSCRSWQRTSYGVGRNIMVKSLNVFTKISCEVDVREATGDIWTFSADIRCIPTNATYRRDGRAVMGAGLAKELVEKFPGIDRELGTMLKIHGSKTRII